LIDPELELDPSTYEGRERIAKEAFAALDECAVEASLSAEMLLEVLRDDEERALVVLRALLHNATSWFELAKLSLLMHGADERILRTEPLVQAALKEGGL